MQKESPFTGMLEDPSFKEHVSGFRTSEKNPESRLESLNQALGIISTLYKAKNYAGALKGYHDIFWGNQPLTLGYLGKMHLSHATPNVTEETIIYTLCQAANDAAGICLQKIISSSKLPENKKDDVADFALRFIKKQMGMGSELGDESIVLRALNNSTKLNTDKALRHFYDKNTTREVKATARKIISVQIGLTRHYIDWAKMVFNTNHMNKNPDNIEFISAIKDKKLSPANNNQISLKYITNALNTLGALHILLGNMTLYPDSPTVFFQKARKILSEADQFHLAHLEGKEIGKEFEQRKLAIQSNLGYTSVIQMLKAKNFNTVDISELEGTMGKVHNNFIKNFLLPLGFIEKDKNLTPEEANDIKDFFRMESITRSLEIFGLMYMSNTNRSTTLNMGYIATEKKIYGAILTHFNIRESSEESLEGDFSLIVKRNNIKKAATRLVGMGMLFLEESKTPADNEDRIFFQEALENLKEMLKVETQLVPA